MKGISLAIETIIYIILAVTVLTVLILFFTGTGVPAQTSIEHQAQRSLLCSEYRQTDPTCGDPGGFDKQARLAEVCAKLDVANCNNIATLTKPCAQSCCTTFCPRPPAPAPAA